jgi:ABC-type Fe3+ transport system permease subunit
MQIGAAFGSAIFIGLMGVIENNYLAGITNPDIQQTQSAIISGVHVSFAVAFIIAFIGLMISIFLRKGDQAEQSLEELARQED